MANFRNLEIWKTAHKLTINMYKLTKKLSNEELYVLVPQLRRAAISVESNIAEGESRFHKKDKLKFFVDSGGSIGEIQTQLLIVAGLYKDIKSSALELSEQYVILGKRINSLISYRINHE